MKHRPSCDVISCSYCPNKMSHTHLFAIYFIYWPNNASKILTIKAHAALVYFYLQASMQ